MANAALAAAGSNFKQKTHRDFAPNVFFGGASAEEILRHRIAASNYLIGRLSFLSLLAAALKILASKNLRTALCKILFLICAVI